MSEPDRDAAAQAARTRNAHLFDVLADSYDSVGVEFFAPIADGLLATVALYPGERVADTKRILRRGIPFGRSFRD